jgi:D-alanyl-D-alanine-carboxypeptidase/D-alanyl-D-alanine-endopeptidase
MFGKAFPECREGSVQRPALLVSTNSANGESIFKELLEVSVADVYTPWEWQDYVPYDHPP